MDRLHGMTPLHAVQKPPYSVEAPGYKRVPGETLPRRHPKARDGLWERPSPDVSTNFDVLRRSARKYADREAIGSRRLIKEHRQVKKVSKLVDGEVREVEKEWTY